jgi:hypothetical protein
MDSREFHRISAGSIDTLTTAEWDEVYRLKVALGHEVFTAIQQCIWAEYAETTIPGPAPPLLPRRVAGAPKGPPRGQ